MTEEEKKEKAQKIYDDLCAFLDVGKLRYMKDYDEKNGYQIVRFAMSGDDLPMEFVFMVDPMRQLIRVFSPLPFTAPEDKRLDMALAVCAASFALPDGSFDYGIDTGKVFFRQTVSFRKSEIGAGLFLYLLTLAHSVVDKYNDKLYAVCKGFMSLEDFIAQESA